MTYARFNRLLLVPSFALLLGACTSSVPLDELPAEYASAFCEVFRGCAGELASYSVQSSASCEPRYEAAVAASAVPRWQALLERGTVSYDASKAAACIEGVRAIGCELNGAAPPAI